MIICKSCGSRNEDDEAFCGECGEYLEWEGERVAPAPTPVAAPAPAAPAPDSGPGLVTRIKSAVGIGSDESADGNAQPPPSVPAATPSKPAAGPAPESAVAGLVMPLDAHQQDATPPASGPAAVRPGKAAPKPRRRDIQPDERRPQPGEIVCGQCGAGNTPTRKFCRRCGTELAEAAVVARPPWWKRIFRRRARTAAPAGTRNTVRTRKSHLGLTITGIVVLALLVAGFVGRGSINGFYNQALDRIKGTKLVNPTTFRASSVAAGHPAALVRDGAPNRYWAPGVAAPARGQWVQCSFAAPFRLVYVRVFNGASDQLTDYLTRSSPQQARITVYRKGKQPLIKNVTLDDKPGAQQLHIIATGVTSVRITIESSYRVTAGRLVAIGEVEFLGRK